MAFSETPIADTYSQHTLPAVYDISSPSGTTTQGLTYMQNLIPKKENGSLYADSRYCISAKYVNPANDGVTSQYCRGMYVWEKAAGTVYYFVIIHDSILLTSKVYSSTNGTTWAAVNTLTNDATTPVRFTEFIDATNTKKLVMVDGIEGYVFTSNAAGTKIVDVDFPTPHVPFPVFLDGYLFLAKAATGDIYNSDLNDPAVWTAGSFISAEMYPDNLQALLKINNYLVAVGTQSCEYFYDAANPTASPLARIEGITHAFGTSFPNSIAVSKDTAMILANSNDGETHFKIIQGTRHQDVPCPFIPIFTSTLQAGNITSSQVRGCFIRQNGELFYCFSFNGEIGGSSYMYSIENNIWVSTTCSGLGFPVYFSAPEISTNSTTHIAGQFTNNVDPADVFFGTLNPLSLWANTSTVYWAVDAFDGTGTTTYILQPQIKGAVENYGTLNRKFMSRFGIDFISTKYTGTDTFLLGFYDDGQINASSTWGATITVNFEYPFLTQLGSFRQRSFFLQYSGKFPIRFRGFEVVINKGIY